jgi:hypothetical protein
MADSKRRSHQRLVQRVAISKEHLAEASVANFKLRLSLSLPTPQALLFSRVCNRRTSQSRLRVNFLPTLRPLNERSRPIISQALHASAVRQRTHGSCPLSSNATVWPLNVWQAKKTSGQE